MLVLGRALSVEELPVGIRSCAIGMRVVKTCIDYAVRIFAVVLVRVDRENGYHGNTCDNEHDRRSDDCLHFHIAEAICALLEQQSSRLELQ